MNYVSSNCIIKVRQEKKKNINESNHKESNHKERNHKERNREDLRFNKFH